MSVFSQTVGGVAPIAFFFGAVVPLVALGVLVECYTLGGVAWLPSDHSVSGIFSGMCLLSLGCFLMLRRAARASVEQIDQQERKLLDLSNQDPLTGLPNRKLFAKQLEQALFRARRQSRLVAVCSLDIDGFKRFNDTLGYADGDKLLCSVAECLRGDLRTHDAVARVASAPPDDGVSRLGGDEFTFVLADLSDPKDAANVTWRLLEVLRKPFLIGDREVFATASVGIALFPSDGDDVETLLRNAGAAMYWAKGCGRNNYQFYANSMNSANRKRLDIENGLREALDRSELSLHYQPIVDGASGEPIGAEALLRWCRPSERCVSPGEFIPVAEETGLIVPIGAWVLRTACAQLQAWRTAGLPLARIAVNLSGVQLRRPTLVAHVRAGLEEVGLGPECLELEITESTIMQDDELTTATLRELHELGVGLALDDFGTGYSSLSYLRRFPIQRIKIDRSFVADIATAPGNAAFTTAIITMAQHMGLRVVAEGVETPEQAALLREARCDELQGYLFGRPVAADHFPRVLQAAEVRPDASDCPGPRRGG